MNDNQKDIKPKKKTIIIISILVCGIALLGGTFAYIISGMAIFNGNYMASTQCFDITYDNTNDDGTMDIVGTLIPSKKDKGGLSGNMSIGSSCKVDAVGNLLLHINESSQTLTRQVAAHCENVNTLETLDYTETECNSADDTIWVTNGSALKYSVYDNNSQTLLSLGYVNTTGQDIKMHKNFIIPLDGSLLDFKIYIWLDTKLIDNSYSDVSLSGYVYADVSQKLPQPNEPVLDSGMIPVTIANDGTVTVVSKDDLNWYDYENKEWANVVLVNEEATEGNSRSHDREYYQNNIGEEVAKEDILAYFVWIPRYKYKISTNKNCSEIPETERTYEDYPDCYYVETIDGVENKTFLIDGMINSENATSIDIRFETKNTEMTLGNATTEYRSHPAFWWDNDNDNIVDSKEILDGIWIGKFETSVDASTDCYINPSIDTCNTSNFAPRIVNDVVSISYQTTRIQFATSLKFAGGTFKISTGEVSFEGNNLYGLTNKIDSHMMKNRDWGAVAYLSYSRYGINKAVRMNNTLITGCGAATDVPQIVDAPSSLSSCAIPFGTSEIYPQSTTGNISGIFDMSGGKYDRVMSIYYPYVGITDFLELPDNKYFDSYSSEIFKYGDGVKDNTLFCNLDLCGGHALYETAGWYDGYMKFLYQDKVSFLRGGLYTQTFKTALFNFTPGAGGAGTNSAFRVTLVNVE